ncbi:MAG: thioredoxin family protein [Deltaproteobacteria bacterium]|nr:thioredoxin family protein [Deltaproteobacteria bacterium]
MLKNPIVLTALAFGAILLVTGLIMLPSSPPAAEGEAGSASASASASAPLVGGWYQTVAAPPAESREALVSDAATAATAAAEVPSWDSPPRQYPGTGLKTYSLASAAAESSGTGKYVILYFWASWCGNCRDFDENVLPDKAVVESLNSNFAFVPLDYDSEREMVQMYRIRAVPTFIFIDPQGKPATMLPGALPAEIFNAVLAFVSTGSYKKMDFDEFARNL